MKRFLQVFACLFLCVSAALADPGNGIVADKKGNIFYTDLAKVWKIDAQGSKTIAVPNVHTHELYMDSAGNLFGEHLWYNGEAANSWGHYVWRLNTSGKLEKVKKDTTGFLEWYSFVRDEAGNMYWLENSIPSNFWKITPAGERKLLGSIALRNIGRLHYHKGTLYFYNRDDVYTLREGDSIRLLRSKLYAPAAGTNNQCERCIESIWTDTADNLYIAVSGNKRIRKIDKQGKISTSYTSSGGWYPVGGAFSANNTLWVLEYNDRNETRCVPAASKQNKEQTATNNRFISWPLVTGISAAIICLTGILLIKMKKKPVNG